MGGMNFYQEKNLQIKQFAENVIKVRNKTLYNEFLEMLHENHITKDELMDLLANDNTTYSLAINAIHYTIVPYMDCQPEPASEIAYSSILVETKDGLVEIPCGEMTRGVMVLDIQDAKIIDMERLKTLDEAMKKQLSGFNKLVNKYIKQ